MISSNGVAKIQSRTKGAAICATTWNTRYLLEAGRMLGAELEKAVNEAVVKLQNEPEVDVIDGLSPCKGKGLGATIS